MENTELIDEEVVEEIIPVSFSSGGGFFKKAITYGGFAIAGALTLEFMIKPIYSWLKTKREAKKASEEYYDEVQE